jgi:hypothetical protein
MVPLAVPFPVGLGPPLEVVVRRVVVVLPVAGGLSVAPDERVGGFSGAPDEVVGGTSGPPVVEGPPPPGMSVTDGRGGVGLFGELSQVPTTQSRMSALSVRVLPLRVGVRLRTYDVGKLPAAQATRPT